MGGCISRYFFGEPLSDKFSLGLQIHIEHIPREAILSIRIHYKDGQINELTRHLHALGFRIIEGLFHELVIIVEGPVNKFHELDRLDSVIGVNLSGSYIA